jgi:hypothetical protein
MRIIRKADVLRLEYKANEKSKIYSLIKSREARLRKIDDEILSARKKVQELIDMRDHKLNEEIAALYGWARMFEKGERDDEDNE